MSVTKDKVNGFLVIDKAKGRASFSSVFRVRQCFGRHLKVGHLGTLDPLATGVLVVAIGEATKLIEYLMGLDKTYEVNALFGTVSSSYDADGEMSVMDVPADFKIEAKTIERVVEQKFSSEIMQVPPAFSAKWVDGKRAYQLARKGREVKLEPVKVAIHDFKLTDFDYPKASFVAKVSSGTYVRSLIHDLGQELGCGAYVTDLRRTKVGEFGLENAVKEVDENALKTIIPIEKVLNKIFDRVDLDDVEYEILTVGRKLDNRRALKDGFYTAYYQNQLKGVLQVNGLPLPGWIKMEKTLHL